jgi:hypothetical protein
MQLLTSHRRSGLAIELRLAGIGQQQRRPNRFEVLTDLQRSRSVSRRGQLLCSPRLKKDAASASTFEYTAPKVIAERVPPQ